MRATKVAHHRRRKIFSQVECAGCPLSHPMGKIAVLFSQIKNADQK
jgi:hypothetical protein